MNRSITKRVPNSTGLNKGCESLDQEYEEALNQFVEGRTSAEELAEMLFIDQQLFENDSTNTLPAFDAITKIATFRWKEEQAGKAPLAPDHFVRLPWWAVQAIASGYNCYVESRNKTPPLNLGDAFQIEGGGRGKRARRAAWKRMPISSAASRLSSRRTPLG